MTKPLPSISDTELEVLKVLWDLGEGSVRDLQDQLRKDWAYTTVQTLLNRLQEKKFVTSRKEGRAFTFKASVSRHQLLGRQLEEMADKVCEGAKAPLMYSLVEKGKFSRQDIQQFRDLLDRLEKETPKQKSKRRN